MVAKAQAQAHQSNARRLMKSVKSKATKTISSASKAVRTAVSSLGVSVRGGQAQSTKASEANAELQSEHDHGDLDMASIMDMDYVNELPRASTAVLSVAPAERDTLTQAAWLPARATVDDMEGESESTSSSGSEDGSELGDEGGRTGTEDEFEDDFEAQLEKEWAELDPSCMLLSPRQANPVIDPVLLGKIAACLSTRYGVSMAIAHRNLANAKIECWGRLVCNTEGGDTVNASEMVKRLQEDSRDASYVRYELLADRNARFRKKAPEYVPETFYRQLRRIFALEMPASDELGTTESQTLILGSILTCKIEMQNDLDMHYFKQHGGTEVVDISTIQCLVGCVKDRGWWVIIDRSRKLARAQFCLD
ncbi:hypothetical protein CVT26_007924 [Gymnopilus dilepis]|uniref:Uncharacterized protein n=1 Tax=Gymnopilus dilepis TaxID=231916 RepID=A0A409W7P7_9AGAR|nr:hypothetical protein CVT26_007924 [Gymnopilus dilepis]